MHEQQDTNEYAEAAAHRHIRPRRPRSALMAATSAAILIAALAGCATGGGNSTSPTASDTAAQQATGVDGVTVIDPWIKATQGEMTGMFGTIVNDTAADVTIASIEVPDAGSTEMHETVVASDGSSTMREIQGGFTIPAGGRLELAPGGDHIMLMELKGTIAPGDELTARLTLDSGEVMTVTATAKEYTGAQESYAPGHSDSPDHGGHDGHGHGDGGHDDHDHGEGSHGEGDRGADHDHHSGDGRANHDERDDDGGHTSGS